MFVFGRDKKLDEPVIVLEIHQYLDHHQALKEMQKFAGLFADVRLGLLVEVPMAGGNLDLHESRSLTCVHSLDGCKSMFLECAILAAEAPLFNGEPRIECW